MKSGGGGDRGWAMVVMREDFGDIFSNWSFNLNLEKSAKNVFKIQIEMRRKHAKLQVGTWPEK